MKIWSSLLLAAALPLGGFAASITTLYNTGVDSLGAPVADGTVDAHYTDTGFHTVFAIATYPAWTSPGASATYLAPDVNAGSSFDGGIYTLDYATTFDLTGFDPLSALIVGGWLTDNYGLDILLNGHSTGNTSTGFTALSAFTISGASGYFTSGINTLDFVWQNVGGPGGVAIAFTSATADPLSAAPEPATMILLGAGLTGLALVGRRRNRSRQS